MKRLPSQGQCTNLLARLPLDSLYYAFACLYHSIKSESLLDERVIFSEPPKKSFEAVAYEVTRSGEMINICHKGEAKILTREILPCNNDEIFIDTSCQTDPPFVSTQQYSPESGLTTQESDLPVYRIQISQGRSSLEWWRNHFTKKVRVEVDWHSRTIVYIGKNPQTGGFHSWLNEAFGERCELKNLEATLYNQQTQARPADYSPKKAEFILHDIRRLVPSVLEKLRERKYSRMEKEALL